MKRKLVNFGIFSHGIVIGKSINDPLMFFIYNKLKEKNYKEEHWQYIFKEQIGGLVLPHNDSRNEIHVRFFKDRIFAEYEIGRPYISHFWGPRYNANKYIFNELKPYLTKNEKQCLCKMLSNINQLEDEKKMQHWNQEEEKNPFLKRRAKEQKLPCLLVDLLLRFGWKTFFSPIIVSLLLYIVLKISKGVNSHSIASVGQVLILVLIFASLMFFWKILPSRGKP